jgi:hypothetical protein
VSTLDEQLAAIHMEGHDEDRHATEVAIAVQALNQMLELGRPKPVHIA